MTNEKPTEREQIMDHVKSLERQLAEATAQYGRSLDELMTERDKAQDQRNRLADALRKCEKHLSPHGQEVADEQEDESGWILLCEVRSSLASINR